MRQSFYHTYLVATYTFREVIKSKIMMNVLILGVFLALISFLASEFTYGVPERVVLDFGLGVLSLSSVGISVFIGATLMSNEMENRTLYMVLSRPIKRSSFLLGKVLGMSTILLVNIIFMGIIILILFKLLGGAFSSLILWSLLFILLESLMILAIVIFFSLITNVVMTVVYTILIYLVGYFLTDTVLIKMVASKPIWVKFINFLTIFLPDLSRLNIKSFVLYDQNVPNSFLTGTVGYGLLYFFAILTISAFIFSRKSLD